MNGIALQLQPGGDSSSDHRRCIVDSHDPVDRVLRGEHPHRVCCSLRLLEIEREEAGRVHGFERARLFRRDCQLDAHLPRGLHERRGAVGRGRQQQQKSRGYFLEAWK